MTVPSTILLRGGLIVLGQRLRRAVCSILGSTSIMLHRSKTRSRLTVKPTNSDYRRYSGMLTQLGFSLHKALFEDHSSSSRLNEGNDMQLYDRMADEFDRQVVPAFQSQVIKMSGKGVN